MQERGYVAGESKSNQAPLVPVQPLTKESHPAFLASLSSARCICVLGGRTQASQ